MVVIPRGNREAETDEGDSLQERMQRVGLKDVPSATGTKGAVPEVTDGPASWGALRKTN